MAGDKEVSIWIRAKDGASTAFKSVERSMQATVRVARNATKMLLGAGAAGAGAVAGLQRMGAAGARNLAAMSAFNEMAGGEGTLALERLRQATRGLVDEQTLMVQSNLALTTGAAKTSEEFARITEQATLLGRAVGLNATEAVEKYTIALSRQSIRRLDDLGIIIDTQEAQENYAKSIGINVSALSEAQKAEAFRAEAMGKADELLAKVGDTTNDNAEAAERLAARIRDLVTALQNMVAQSPAIGEFFDLLATGFAEIADPGSAMREQVTRSVLQLGDDPVAVGIRLYNAETATDPLQEELDRLIQSRQGAAPRELNEINRLIKEQEQLIAENAIEVEVLRSRWNQLGQAQKRALSLDEGGDEGPGFSFGAGFENTTQQARALLEQVNSVRDSLTDARNEMMMATTQEELDAATEKARELNRQFEMMVDFIEQYGEKAIQLSAAGVGVIGRAGRTDVTGDPYDLPGLIRRDGGVDMPAIPGLDVEKTIDAMDRLNWAVETLFDDMVDVVSRGTEITTSRVTQMIAQIAAQAVGGPLGSVIGFVGGLISGRMRRDERLNDTVSVRVEEYGPRAQDQMKEQRPMNITSIIETGGNEVERIELELRRRQARDATARIAPPGGR